MTDFVDVPHTLNLPAMHASDRRRGSYFSSLTDTPPLMMIHHSLSDIKYRVRAEGWRLDPVL